MSVDEWDHRELCSDGACTGVIGPDGTCKVCGRAAPNWGDERNRGLLAAPDDDAEDADDDDAADADDAAEDDDLDKEADDEQADGTDGEAEPAQAASGDPEWTQRKLCDDGACIGVIGKDGVCTVCGSRSAVA